MFINIKNKLSLSSYSANRSYAQHGASLIEVIVSLLILGVGLLGMLSLQANGLNGNQRANFVTDAQILAQDMADRILASANTANSTAAATGVRNGSYGNITIVKDSTVTNAACTTASPCNSAAAITFNQDEWLAALNNSSLPRGRATVTSVAQIAPQTGSLYTIQVMWDQDRTGGAVNCTITNCFQMEVRIP